MGYFAEMNIDERNSRDHYPPEGFAIWCRIEDLSSECGYDPSSQFGMLRDIANTYHGYAGRNPDEFREEHPLQALADEVRRYLAEYPEEAAAMLTAGAAAAAGDRPEQPLPGKAA